MPDALIICARNQEVAEIAQTIRDAGGQKQVIQGGKPNGFSYVQYQLVSKHGSNFSLAIANCGDMGNVYSAVRTAAFINEFAARLYIFCGIAGSLEPSKARLGDVIIPTKVHHYRQDKVYDNAPDQMPDILTKSSFECFEMMSDRHVRFRQATASVKPVNEALQLLTDLEFQKCSEELETIELEVCELDNLGIEELRSHRPCQLIREEDLFSWEMVFNSALYREKLKDKNALGSSVAVDMESFGFLLSISELREYGGMPAVGLVVRGISDYVGYKAQCDSFQSEAYRHLALRNAARVAIKLAQVYDYDSLQG